MSARAPRRSPEPLIDLSVPRRCHVVGVGGPGMAPIAVLLAGSGHSVTGSDVRDSGVVATLRARGIQVSIGHDSSHVVGADVVLHSTAVPADNVELLAARAAGIPVRHRSGILASLVAQHATVGVAGTHGKTTTTALLTTMLAAAGTAPWAIVGGEVPGFVAGALVGDGGPLVLECDESDGTLDVLSPAHLVVTNVDVDHLDYFDSFSAVQDSFAEAARRAVGVVVLNADDPASAPVRAARPDAVTFGRLSGDVCIVGFEALPDGSAITLDGRHGRRVCRVPLRGEHNAMNLAAAFTMACELGTDPDIAADAAGSFPGVGRRFTERGTHNGALLVDDYAHLPAEISAAVATMRAHPDVSGRVVAVFQPNRFHRIATMADAYADCFVGADIVVITDVYASGTERIEGVTGLMVADAIRAAHPDAHVEWAPERDDIVRVVHGHLRAGDGCISMGCGDIETFPDDLGLDRAR